MAFSTLLTGCSLAYIFVNNDGTVRDKDLQDAQGHRVFDCYGLPIRVGKSAREFWWHHDPPKGTTEFVCKDQKAYLPKQATDCQGKLLSDYPNGMMGFKQQYNFPKDRTGKLEHATHFICRQGQVVPIEYP